MLRQSIHDFAIVHDACRQLLERLPHLCMLLVPALVFVILLGILHHAEDILYGCAELFWNFIVKRNSKLILEMLDRRLVRFRRDVSVPTVLSLLRFL